MTPGTNSQGLEILGWLDWDGSKVLQAGLRFMKAGQGQCSGSRTGPEPFPQAPDDIR